MWGDGTVWGCLHNSVDELMPPSCIHLEVVGPFVLPVFCHKNGGKPENESARMWAYSALPAACREALGLAPAPSVQQR